MNVGLVALGQGGAPFLPRSLIVLEPSGPWASQYPVSGSTISGGIPQGSPSQFVP